MKGKNLTQLEQGKLLAEFIHQKKNPMNNRRFYDLFYNQQNKADKIRAIQDFESKVEDVKRLVGEDALLIGNNNKKTK